MIFEMEVETWKPKDFVHYVKNKCNEKGISYEPSMPFDIIMMGRLQGTYRKVGKTNFLLKRQIDEVFDQLEFTKISSLKFLYTMLKPAKEERETFKKLKSDEIIISEQTRKALEALRNG